MKPFHPGWKIYNIPVYTTEANGSTFYTIHPNLFAKISVYISAILLAVALLFKVINRGKNEE